MSDDGAAWSLEVGEEIVAHPAPGVEIRLAALATPTTPRREQARRQCRERLRQMLAARLGSPPEGIALIGGAGAPPRVGGHPEIGLSISHENGLSLVAVNFSGAVGVDLLRLADVQAADELAALGRDYLGPAAAAALAALPDDERRPAFARAWTRHEARLKSTGRGLTEWHPALAAALAACPVWTLSLPNGHVGALAVPGGA